MKALGTLLLVMMIFAAKAQIKSEIDLEEFAESIFQLQDEDVPYEDIYEALLLYAADPLNLNTADQAELSSLFVLSPVQIQALLEHIELNGSLISIYELQSVRYFDLETIQRLLPFVTVVETGKSGKSLFQRIQDDRNRFFLLRVTRIAEEQAGYEGEDPRYAGSPEKIYGRFRTSSRGDFSLGMTFEKDAGEAFSDEGFDFYSFHAMLENQGSFSKIILGDFQIQSGQGLIFGAGFNPGKGAETINTVKRNTIGIRPYSSVLETGFFRGAGVEYSFEKVNVTAFASHLDQDASIQIDSLDAGIEAFASSIRDTGMHRTESEIEAKDQISESSIGGLVEYRPSRKLNFGMSAISTKYSSSLRRSEAPYNFYEFRGRENFLIGSHGSYQWQSLNMFGEVARSSSGGMAMVGGVIASVSRSIDVAVSLRNYDSDFHSFYGNAFGEGSRTINETGTYWGLKFRPTSKISVVGYYDRFSFPWLRFGVDAPSRGAEWLGRFTYKPERAITLFFQVREETKQVSITDGNLSSLQDRIKRNYILNLDYKINSNLSMKSRLQTSTQHRADIFTKGYALIQDINYSSGKFSFSGRVAIFETDDYDNRQYTYERDVLYAFSIPAYNGVGVRNYLLVKYNLSDRLDFWVRYGRFSYRDRQQVGSGLDESDGPTRTEIKWMMRLKF